MTDAALLDLSTAELEAELRSLGQPAYRARQIRLAVFRELATSYDDMTTLPVPVRRALAERFPFPSCDAVDEVRSSDGRTRKTLFRLRDGETIETVIMDYPDRWTVCVSSQVGCAVGCPFCATAEGGLVRNLSAGEIVAQVLHGARSAADASRRVTHVVYMGMGEPLANYDAVLASIRVLNDPDGFALGARSFTVSTAGDVPGIARLTSESLQVNLAVSLHAGADALRSTLIPLNRRYPLADLLRACRAYTEATRRRITFEVALIDGVNDRPEHAVQVAERLRGMLCHVNLIPWNPIPRRSWRRSASPSILNYERILSDAGIPVTLRDSRGIEIEAGCGQLRSRSPSERTKR